MNGPITFTVSYTLPEYLSFVREHLPVMAAARGRPRLPGWARVAALWGARLAFRYKKRKMPVCAFVIDDERIVRTSAAGVQEYAWSQVEQLHAYSAGYLLALPKGALPLPYRCLSAAQIARIAQLYAARAGLTPGLTSGA
ncbi:MAG: YcxB family protein [Pseudomonadota bacterium]